MSTIVAFLVGAAAGMAIWSAPAPDLSHRIMPVQAQDKDRKRVEEAETRRATFAPFPENAQFETADTWVHDGKRYRLYGLQSCLRGTSITLDAGVERDCGEFNVIMVQAAIRDSRPVCSTIRKLDQFNELVVCRTTAGNRAYDLATFLIAQGWGFAAVDGKDAVIVPTYRVAEKAAREARAGLWAYSDMPHPVARLQQTGISP
jgi:endonuclease YncB( thermonuclease family)